jgi:hypothetical protein
VLAFAHNSHLQRGLAAWSTIRWWPAGSHANVMLGPQYAVIGSALGESSANGIGSPEKGTIEAELTTAPGPVRYLPTHRGNSPEAKSLAALPARARSFLNQSYFSLSAQSVTDFDGIVIFDSMRHSRGGPLVTKKE